MNTCTVSAITLTEVSDASFYFDEVPLSLTTNFLVPNPICGTFTTLFSQESGPGSGDLATLIQGAFVVPTTSISPAEPSYEEGDYSIRVTLTLDDYPNVSETQVFTVTLTKPCSIANLSLSS